MIQKLNNFFSRWLSLPEEVQQLVDVCESVREQSETGDIFVYPGGEYGFTLHTPDGDMEPVVFPTPQERAAFGAGMNYAIGLMGGQAIFVGGQDPTEFDKFLEEMSEEDRSLLNKKSAGKA